jgi:predicted CoA-binding protein
MKASDHMSQHEWLSYKNWAVVGASEKEKSYGKKITKKLIEKGYNVIPISRNYGTILGEKAYPRLIDFEGTVDVVDFVVDPTIGIRILDDVIEKGIKKIILQPGTSSPEILQKAENHGIEVLQSCVLVLLAQQD